MRALRNGLDLSATINAQETWSWGESVDKAMCSGGQFLEESNLGY